MQIHELNSYSGTLSAAYMVVDDGTDTGKEKIEDITAPLDARIDNIIAGPASSAQEVIDARLGNDGVVYASLGDAIRDQANDLKNNIEAQKSNINAITEIADNLFDGDYAVGYAVLSNNTFAAAANCITAIIPCKSATHYFIQFSGNHNRFTVATSTTSAFPVGESVSNITPAHENMSTCWEVVTGATDKYLFVYVSNQNETPDLYIGLKEVFNIIPYESPKVGGVDSKAVNDYAAHLSKMLSSQFLTNLFDGNYISDVGLLSFGTIPGSGLFTAVNGSRTIIVPVKPNTEYYFRSFDSHNRIRLAYSDTFPHIGDTVTIIDSAAVTGPYTYYSVSGATSNWLIITVTNQGDEPRAQITENEDSLTFLGYDSMSPLDEGGESLVNSYYFLDDITGIFDADQAPAALDAQTTKITDIYTIYDSLVSAYPNYVSKSVLGTVSTENLEMRKYTFSGLNVQNNSSYTLNKPKLVFIAGIHGYEQGSSYCLALVMKQLMEGTDPISKFIKNNIEIIVVPVANPYGYNHNQRKNQNGVDINRNFAAGWVATGSPSDDYYSGASAASEEETQILTTLLNNNNDSYYAVDFHNIANGYPLLYLYNNSQVQLCNSLFSTLTSKWLSEYSGFPTNQLLGYCNTGVNACFAKQALSIGIKSFVAEAPWVMPVIGSTQYDIPTLTAGSDVFGNVIVTVLKALTK